jgi:hypothetical protein
VSQPAPQQPAAPAAPPSAPPAAGPSSSEGGTYSVHSCAQKAQAALEKLATELAHAGAPKNVTGTVSKMADAVGQIVDGTAKAAPAPQPAPQQPHTMDSAANSLVADVAARKAQGG